jgi:hypothetical protein
VDVLEVYRGDPTLVGQKIGVYEDCVFDYSIQLFVPSGSFLPMKEGREYYVFLLEREYLKAYQETLPYTEFRAYPVMFSIVPVNNIPPHFTDPAIPVTYKEIAEDDFLCYSQEQYDEMRIMIDKLTQKYIVLS